MTTAPALRALSLGAGVQSMPGRIRLRRTRGWRLPARAVIVDRRSRWGNPYEIHEHNGRWLVLRGARGYGTYRLNAGAAGRAALLASRWSA